jgi:hypothetical protein
MLPMLLNSLSVISAVVTMPGTGVWIADLDVDLDISGIVPSGRAIFTVGTSILSGTIDPRATGRFGQKAHVQLVGGGNGWDSDVPALHLHADFGVLSTAVFNATAALVGEAVVDSLPKVLGTDYVRTAGPASRVLAGVDWYVNTAGVTIVGPRIPKPFNPLSVDILEWSADTRRAILASDELVEPGTILLDTRFGTATVRDIEQHFGPEGARCIAWCATSDIPAIPGAPASEVAGHRLTRALGALAREATSSVYLRPYKYRVAVQEPDKRLTLQATSLDVPVPLILQSVEMWPGLPGHTALVTPGTEVIVIFLDGNPSKPVVAGFASLLPTLETSINTLRFAVGLGALPVVVGSPAFLTWVTAITAAVNGLAPGSAVLPVPLVSTKTFTD